MTSDELKKALFAETPVKYEGTIYTKITAIIYRKSGNGVKVSAELLDKSKFSVVIADAKKIEEI